MGVTIKELADYLGHSDLGFTLRTYTHLLPSSHEQARRAVDRLYKPASSGERSVGSWGGLMTAWTGARIVFLQVSHGAAGEA